MKKIEKAKKYYLQTVEIKNYNVMINGRKFFDQTVKNNLRTYDNIHKIKTGPGDDYTTRCLLNYPCFKKTIYYYIYYILLYLLFQQINFSGSLDKADGATMHFITKEVKEIVLYFSKGTVKVLWFYFVLKQCQYKMTQNNTLNVKLFNLQLKKLKSAIKMELK